MVSDTNRPPTSAFASSWDAGSVIVASPRSTSDAAAAQAPNSSRPSASPITATTGSAAAAITRDHDAASRVTESSGSSSTSTTRWASDGTTATMSSHSVRSVAASSIAAASRVASTECCGRLSAGAASNANDASVKRSISKSSDAAVAPPPPTMSPPTTSPSLIHNAADPRSPSSARRPDFFDEARRVSTSVSGKLSIVPWSATAHPPARSGVRRDPVLHRHDSERGSAFPGSNDPAGGGVESGSNDRTSCAERPEGGASGGWGVGRVERQDRAASVMTSTGAGTPVQCSKATAAWWTSIDSPFEVRQPAASAAAISAVRSGW